MFNSISNAISRVAKEPPFRLAARALLSQMKLSVHTRSTWELSPRPHYLLGLLTGAKLAAERGVKEISALEFGVAGGNGLVALQQEAEAIERETGVGIKVYGFDNGSGLPELIGDYRDHPDAWIPGDFVMDEVSLRKRLTSRTKLIIGNVNTTVSRFFEEYNPPPMGFVSVDVDLYSSTRDALKIFSQPGKKMLMQVPMYFDDVGQLMNHKFAGELLAINEFNENHADVKIDRWIGVGYGRPFPERAFLERMYMAHDLVGITNIKLNRKLESLPLKP